MALKEELAAMLVEDRKKLQELVKQLESLVQEREELQKAIESEETLLTRKFGINFKNNNDEMHQKDSAKDVFSYKSIPDGAFEVISDGGNKAIHLKEIFRTLNERGKKVGSPSSIGVALRRDKRFKLVGPNVFVIADEYYKK